MEIGVTTAFPCKIELFKKGLFETNQFKSRELLLLTALFRNGKQRFFEAIGHLEAMKPY